MRPDNSIFSTKYRPLAIITIGALSLLSLLYVFRAPAESSSLTREPELSDCRKCHTKIVDRNQSDGHAHKNKVTCKDCHVGHPPAQRGIIPRCHKCHKGQDHFSLNHCLGCHTDPHTPLRITLPKHVTKPCLTCHHEQIKELQKYPSLHSTLYCTSCHTRHGYKPNCFACHAGHMPFMTMKDCRRCHKPHMPLHVTYDNNVPSAYCGACHKRVYQLLSTSHAKHRKLLCVSCHTTVHKTIPKCTKCHLNPHNKTLIKRFNSCLDCHKDPHNLQLNRIDIRLELNGEKEKKDS